MFKRKSLSLATLSIVTANLLASTVLAASVANWPNTSSPTDVRVNATTTDQQMEPVMIQTSDGNYLLAWSDYRTNGFRSDIYTQ
ncbi:hypothetical protein IT411_02600, partial [Candidatus Peregrinibacteria bacterium]|nr:hypothetical protein [Candidatus Peregrinibacteria bacterium]